MSKTITITDVQITHIEARRRDTPEGVEIDLRADYEYVDDTGTPLTEMPQTVWHRGVPDTLRDDIAAFIQNKVKPHILDKEGI